MQSAFTKIYLTCDHAGFDLTQQIEKRLVHSYPNLKVQNLCPVLDQDDDYPLSAKLLADVLKSDSNSMGVALCGTGQGICIALNRFGYIRAAVSERSDFIKLSRTHNDANVLCLPARYIDVDQALALIEDFIFTKFCNEERHNRRIDQLTQLV